MSTADQNFRVSILKALAHSTRLQIVTELLAGTKCVTDIHDILPASQANISQHLSILRHAEIVDFTQVGSQRCYYVCRPAMIKGILTLMQAEQPDIGCQPSAANLHKQS